MTDLEKLKMNDETIKQNDVVKRYLQNKLTPEEIVEFEEYILDKPELLEQLELDMVLVKTLPKVAVNETQKLAEKGQQKLSLWQLLFGTPLKASLGTGLACAMAAVLLFPVMQNQTPALGGNIELFYLSQVRGAPSEQTFDITQTADTLIFVLEVEFNQPEPFTVKLVNQDTNQPITLLPNYLPSEVGEIYISVNAKDMPKGNYIFEYYPVVNKNKKNTSKLTIN